MSQNNIFVSEDFQYTTSNKITTLQNVDVRQSDSILSVLIELRNEIASLKTEVVDIKKEVKELKDDNNRSLINLTEEVIAVKLEFRKHHGDNIMVDDFKDAQKLPVVN